MLLLTTLRRALPRATTLSSLRSLATSPSSSSSSSPSSFLTRHRLAPSHSTPPTRRSYASSASPNPPYTSKPIYHQPIRTISDPSYSPFAPNPFVTMPNTIALDALPAGYTVVDTPEGLPKYALFTGEIERSPNDDRDYRLIILENGMEVSLVSDPKTDKAAAAMDVKVGHLSDPEDIPGLAHFCEHLMFMGTEKYPAENDYTEFLTQHSGSSNAFTGMDQTCYYFDVQPSALPGALDRFAQFFISPLFDPSCTEREANAVHSENSKNLQSDMWRFFQLDKSLSSRTHAYWRFGTGTRETLYDEPLKRGEDVRKRLIEWCEKHYSANVCKLAVVGKDSLEDLTKTVLEHFSAVPNRHLTPDEFPGSPFTEKELKRTVFVKSVRDQRTLELSFPFPDESAFYASKPGSFLSHLIGHEGKGSVLSYLKEKGWANGMSAGSGNGAAGFEFFKISVDLTAEGLDNYEDVVSALFGYITLLRSHPLPEWAFHEVSALSKLSFQFKEQEPASSTASRMSMVMSRPFPRELVLSAPYICTEWLPGKIGELLGLMTPENGRIFLSAQTEIGGRTYGEKEKWYGTEYCVEPMSEKIVSSASLPSSAFPTLSLPPPNALVPTSLALKSPTKSDLPAHYKPSRRPAPIKNTETTRLWFKKDDRWWVPRAGSFFLLRSPLVDSSPLRSMQSRLFTELIRDSLVEYAYDAELAGLSYTFDQSGDGILLTVDGYDDKMKVLVEVVTGRMREYQVDPKRFEIVVDQLRRVYENFRLEQPYQHVGFDGGMLIQSLAWTVQEKLSALAEITPENLQVHIDELLGRIHIEALVHGNFTEEEALGLVETVEENLKPLPLTGEELKSHTALIVPEGLSLARRPVENPAETNSSIEQFTYIGDLYDDDLRCKLSLFGTIISEPLFDDLRGKQQLGYIVNSGARKSISFMGCRVIIQSEYDANFLEERVNQFWNDFRVKLVEMKDEDFEKYKEAVVNLKLEDHKNMWQESSSMWVQCSLGWFDFDQKTRDAALVAKLTKSDILTFFDRYFFHTPTNPIRRLSIHVTSQKLLPPQLGQLIPHLQALEIPIDDEQFGAFGNSRPSVEEAKAFAEQVLKANGKSEEEVEKLKGVIEGLREWPVLEGYELIGDREQWRKERERAPPAHPVEEYAHLVPASLRIKQ